MAEGSWATSTGSLTLRSGWQTHGSPPPTREARLQFNRTMLLFLFELFFLCLRLALNLLAEDDFRLPTLRFSSAGVSGFHSLLVVCGSGDRPMNLGVLDKHPTKSHTPSPGELSFRGF